MAKERNSSIEFLKIIAMLMIVFSHITPEAGAITIEDWIVDYMLATTNIQILTGVFLEI